MKFTNLITHHKLHYAPVTAHDAQRQVLTAIGQLAGAMPEEPTGLEAIQRQRLAILLAAMLAAYQVCLSPKDLKAVGAQFDDAPDWVIQPKASPNQALMSLRMLGFSPSHWDGRDIFTLARFMGVSKEGLIEDYLEFSEQASREVKPLADVMARVQQDLGNRVVIKELK